MSGRWGQGKAEALHFDWKAFQFAQDLIQGALGPRRYRLGAANAMEEASTVWWQIGSQRKGTAKWHRSAEPAVPDADADPL